MPRARMRCRASCGSSCHWFSTEAPRKARIRCSASSSCSSANDVANAEKRAPPSSSHRALPALPVEFDMRFSWACGAARGIQGGPVRHMRSAMLPDIKLAWHVRQPRACHD
ncbi:hypothetical protein G6F65_022809 [Rhizopus arrhizus]|nr:hypothetical protein G6F65_022809 [Rhizopus arrhizus]